MNILDISISILTLLGALGIFLYGMKLMSESLQKVAGTRLRRVLSVMSSNKYYGIFAGFSITGLVQSSSATTVLIVSFVNAGLISVKGSIAVILGANIGTTVTAWLVSLLGFTFSISSLALPLVGLSLPLVFAKRGIRSSWGEFILGFALLFTGLQFMKEIFPVVSKASEVYAFLQSFTELGYASVLLFVLIGMLITMIIQSSSATMALTIVLAYQGIIPYDLSAAMILGENIGTTITANLAATVANVSAKRAARAHFLINVIGVAWMLIVFRIILGLIDQLFIYTAGVPVFASNNALLEDQRELLPLGLATFHSLFNILNAIILTPFIPQIYKATRKLVRRSIKPEKFSIKLMNTGIVSLSELSMLEARQSISRLGLIIGKMFSDVSTQFQEKDDRKFYKIAEKIAAKEDVIDEIRLKINEFLTTLSAEELSRDGSKKVSAMKTIADNLESIGDRCFELSQILVSKKEKKVWFSQEQREGLQTLLSAVKEALRIMNINLETEYELVRSEDAVKQELLINELRNTLLAVHLEEIKLKDYRAEAGGFFREIFSVSERLGDHIINITESILLTHHK